MNLGVICDGISRDLAHAIDVMDEFNLTYAELQFVGDKEVGDHSVQEIREIKALLEDRGTNSLGITWRRKMECRARGLGFSATTDRARL